jgi:hypothetical protein
MSRKRTAQNCSPFFSMGYRLRIRPDATSESLEIDLQDGTREDVLATLEREESLHAMRSLFEQALDPTEKQVMVLHFADEMALDSITRLLQLKNPSGARAYVVSAKRKLATAVQRWRAAGKRGGK